MVVQSSHLTAFPGWLNEHQWAQLRGLEALPVFKTGSHSLCNTLEQVCVALLGNTLVVEGFRADGPILFEAGGYVPG